MEDKGTKHGHPRFYEILDSLGKLHSEKNHDYAAGGDPLGNFKRRAEFYSRYPGLDLSDPIVVTVIDALKQLDAALWLLSNKHTAKVEGISKRLKDVAVYSIIAMVLDEEKRGGEMKEDKNTWLHPCSNDCGGKPVPRYGGGQYWVECPHCGHEGPRRNFLINAQLAWDDQVLREVEERG